MASPTAAGWCSRSSMKPMMQSRRAHMARERHDSDGDNTNTNNNIVGSFAWPHELEIKLKLEQPANMVTNTNSGVSRHRDARATSEARLMKRFSSLPLNHHHQRRCLAWRSSAWGAEQRALQQSRAQSLGARARAAPEPVELVTASYCDSTRLDSMASMSLMITITSNTIQRLECVNRRRFELRDCELAILDSS